MVASQREQEAKKEQHAAALAWCAEKDKGAYAAVNATDADGKALWPLITRTSLQQRIHGDTDYQDLHASSRTLTTKEEEGLVEVCKLLNRHGQGIDRAHLGRLVIDSLVLRPTLNKGRAYMPLSHNAKEMLRSGSPTHKFYQRFFVAHPDISERNPCNEEMLRVKWMTPKVSADHFKYLGMCLESCGILVDGEIIDASRVLNSDECPNPWQGTGGRTKLIAAFGEPCKKLIHAARENTTLDVMIGLDGYLFDPHLIFKGKYVQKQMIPDITKIPNSKISTADKGYQTGATLLQTLKHWDLQLVRREVKKPVCWMTDGHSSRFNFEVLQWCRDNQWKIYVSPPHTTGIHQPLDQIFKTWHDIFNARVASWSELHTGIQLEKSTFINLFAEAWPKWTKPDIIVAAFRRCGVSIRGLDPAAIPQDKLKLSEMFLPTTPGTELAAQEGAAETPGPSELSHDPPEEQGGYREQLRALLAWGEAWRDRALELQLTPMTLKATHPSWQPRTAAPEPARDRKDEKKSIKGAWGDMDALQMLETHKANAEKEVADQEASDARKRMKEKQRTERAELENAKRTEKEECLQSEGSVTELLKVLSFSSSLSAEVTGAELQAFAKANKAQLRTLGVDTSKLARKDLMSALVQTFSEKPAS